MEPGGTVLEKYFKPGSFSPNFIHKPKEESTRDFLAKAFTKMERGKYTRVLACAIVNRTAYLAVEEFQIYGDRCRRIVYPLICSLYYRKGYYNFAYEVIREEEGPYMYDAPLHILELLTPPRTPQGRRWREKCLENVRRKKITASA